ncbi:MAG: hypothetical protein JWO38_1360 [Gemmataceae bacterium]|nr:hypothetical protein [Gemmataceae bacterium]
MHRNTPNSRPAPNPLGFLSRLARPNPVRERCELCSAGLADEHEHLVEPAARRLVCACGPCAILFSARAGSKYRRVPRRVEDMSCLRLTDLQWEGFGLPIALAFFLHSSPAGRVVAVYPSPAGATESALPLDAWEELVAENPDLGDLEPDVEALLVNRVGEARNYFRVGIDRCYQLAGLLRTHWRGFSGGDALWAEIGRFFDDLKRRSGSGGGPANA